MHLKEQVRDLRALEERIKVGGGEDKIETQHREGKLTARERIAHLVDTQTQFQEIGLLIAYDQYDGRSPAAGVVTGIGIVSGRETVIVANDVTVKAGSWWPETIAKILRSQEIAMRSHIPIIYLVESAGANLPYQGGVFPGRYGAARIFYYSSIMRRGLKIPQIAAIMGKCVGGGAYLPALSDVILMVEGASFMGLGGPNLVKGATGCKTDSETLGGAKMHNEISGVAHYRSKDDLDCLGQIRELIARLPRPYPKWTNGKIESSLEPKRPTRDLYEILPADHRIHYDMREALDCLVDDGSLLEFQADYAREMICADARLCGIDIGLIANNRGLLPGAAGKPPRVGGIIYTESAEKTAYFIETCHRQRKPLLFIQDVSGFMVGVEAEQSGIIRAGARLVEAMAMALVPKIVLTINHAAGAGYYAMAGQGFDPDFIFSLPTGRMGVMEGESAVMALFAKQLERLEAEAKEPSDKLRAEMAHVRAEYERQLDAKYAAARGFVDAIITPEEIRPTLTLALRTALNAPC